MKAILSTDTETETFLLVKCIFVRFAKYIIYVYFATYGKRIQQAQLFVLVFDFYL